MFELRNYLTETGRDVFTLWHMSLAILAIASRAKTACGSCAWMWGRATGCITHATQAVILLLCGGDKRTQQTDIAKACAYWQDWKNRKPIEENDDEKPITR